MDKPLSQERLSESDIQLMASSIESLMGERTRYRRALLKITTRTNSDEIFELANNALEGVDTYE